MAKAKHKQVGPPVRVEDYMISVTDDDLSDGILARAVLVPEDELCDHPRRIFVEAEGLRIDARNVSSESRVTITNKVLEALLKVGGWKQVQRG